MNKTKTKPQFHRIISEKQLPDGSMQFNLKFNPTAWEQASCAGLDTESFYPAQEKYDLADEQYLMKRLCGDCPIMAQCLEWALVHERYGIWGGTSPYKRFLLRNKLGWKLNDIALPSFKR